MHPRTREVRKPDSGIDPRGSGSGQPPLLQGFLKHRKPGAAPKPTATEGPPKASAAEAPKASAAEAPKVATRTGSTTPKPRKAAAPKAARPAAAKARPEKA